MFDFSIVIDRLFARGVNEGTGINQHDIRLIFIPGDPKSAAKERPCGDFRIDKIFRTPKADNTDHARCFFLRFQSELRFFKKIICVKVIYTRKLN